MYSKGKLWKHSLITQYHAYQNIRSPWVSDTSLEGTKCWLPMMSTIERFHCSVRVYTRWHSTWGDSYSIQSWYQTPYPKGDRGEPGAVTYISIAICSLRNFRGMNLIGWVLLNCVVALHNYSSSTSLRTSISPPVTGDPHASCSHKWLSIIMLCNYCSRLPSPFG